MNTNIDQIIFEVLSCDLLVLVRHYTLRWNAADMQRDLWFAYQRTKAYRSGRKGL